MPKPLEDWLDSVYRAGGEQDKLDAAYDAWARDYDQDLWASGNPYTAVMAGMAGRYIPEREALILDGGCGTGNMGRLLQLLGYGNLVGLDASEGMLAVAAAKGCYRALHRLLLGAQIDLPPASFDAVTAAGVLTHGHAPPESLDGLLALAKPAAPLIFSLSQPAMESGFGDKIGALTASRAWRLEEQSPPFRTYPFSERYADLHHWICVYRKAG
jgi:SAM-dependent methyltransferase